MNLRFVAIFYGLIANSLGMIREFLLAVVISVIGASLINGCLFRAVSTKDGSGMAPELQSNDYMIYCLCAFVARQVQCGDIVIFQPQPGSQLDDSDRQTIFIGRVVALGGETISLSHGSTVINGRPLEEKYVQIHGDIDRPAVRVPNQDVFILPDDRASISRPGYFTAFGPIPIKDVYGRAWVTFWPLHRFHFL